MDGQRIQPNFSLHNLQPAAHLQHHATDARNGVVPWLVKAAGKSCRAVDDLMFW
jgi:hypothetical protein